MNKYSNNHPPQTTLAEIKKHNPCESGWKKLPCDYDEHVLHLFEAKYPEDKRPRQAIEVSRRYADGKATDEELADARADADAAWVAAGVPWIIAAGVTAAAARAAADDAMQALGG